MGGFKKSIVRTIWQKIYRIYAIRENVSVGKHVHIGMGSILSAPHTLQVGNDVYIGKNCTIEVDGYIGNCVLVANNVGLIGRWDHDLHAIGYPIRYAPWIGDDDYKGDGKDLGIVIEDDVWVGFGGIILSGVHVERGAIIAAGAVVTKDVASYMIVAGIPAKPVGMRFTGSNVVLHEQGLKSFEPPIG